ncbi:MAG: GTP-binding protein [Candidatus Helarchaeota archaeon]|nr:GTP-binding protein [Candidatus Helarchaeota archaeon]
MEKIIYKILLLGDPGVGKTALITRYVDNRFITDYKATLGFDIFIQKIKSSKVEFSLAIWDLAGQEQYTSLKQSYYEGAQGVILVYDVTNLESYKNIIQWLTDLGKVVKAVPITLVGNKIDLTDEIKITTEDGKRLEARIKAMKFYETSAKTGQNVNIIFEELAETINAQSLA